MPQPSQPAVRLDHVNIRTHRLAETARFYADVLGLVEGDPPAGLDPARIRWMFDAAGAPLVHIAIPHVPGLPCDGPTGGIDHIAFALTDYAGVVARLDRAGLPWEERRIDAIALTQIFLNDPNGVRLELNIRDA